MNCPGRGRPFPRSGLSFDEVVEMGAHIDPHPSVRKRIQQYNPRLDIRYNDKWELTGDVTYRYIIGQPVLRAAKVDDGTVVMVEDFIGLFTVPQAQDFDERWLAHLDSCKVDREAKRKSWLDQRIESAQAGKKELHDAIDAQSDELWYGWQKMSHDFRFPNKVAKDPTAERKDFEDKHGRPMI